MSASPVPLKFQVGARTLWALPRRLERVALSLDDALAGRPPELPALTADAHGYLLTSLPRELASRLDSRGLRANVRQAYTRRYADLTIGFDDYLARFSSKTRATLARKTRRFGEGPLDVRTYRTPDEIAEFHALAREVSRLSYQERLLEAGLPEGAEALAEIRALAAADAVRAFLLFREERPASYLYLPARGETLIYAYLGYDPAIADLSPGSVLQLEAMRLLMDEGRFARLDFTEGDGQHKRLFATGGVDCVDLLLLRPTLGNRLGVAALETFDRVVAGAKARAGHPVARRLARAVTRG